MMKSKITIAVDFDGTCVVHNYPHVGETLPNCVNVLKQLVDNGHNIALDTMRDWINPSPHNRLNSVMDDAIQWFQSNGIPLYSVQPHKHASSWTKSTKCHGEISIDDRNLGVPLDINGSVDWFEVEKILKLQGII